MRGAGRPYGAVRTDFEITGPQDRLLAFVGRSPTWKAG
jgi:hypothetical protein